MDIPLARGVNPGGGANTGGVLSEGETWSDVGVMDESESWRLEGTKISRGSRLTPERLEKMQSGTKFLSDTERQLFIDILFEYEGAIGFDDSEMGILKQEIEPHIIIHTVPDKL